MRYTLVIPHRVRLQILEGNIRDILLQASLLQPTQTVELRVNGVTRLTACNGQIERDFINDLVLCNTPELNKEQQQEIASAWEEVRFVNRAFFTRFELLSLAAMPWYLGRNPSIEKRLSDTLPT